MIYNTVFRTLYLHFGVMFAVELTFLSEVPRMFQLGKAVEATSFFLPLHLEEVKVWRALVRIDVC